MFKGIVKYYRDGCDEIWKKYGFSIKIFIEEHNKIYNKKRVFIKKMDDFREVLL